MRQRPLRPAEKELLREAVSKHKPDLLPIIGRIGTTRMSREHREELRGALADELCATGLKPDDEPNERGLMIEEIIDVLWYWSEDYLTDPRRKIGE